MAVCHALALFVAVSIAANISGGDVNPAVTFGLAVGGPITILTGVFYWIAQLLGAVAASFLLSFVTGGLVSLVYFRCICGYSIFCHAYDAKYMNKLGFKCILTGIIFIKYYITQTKIYKVIVFKKRLRK